MKNGVTNWNLKGRERAEHGGRVKRLGGGPWERVKNRRQRSWIWDLGKSLGFVTVLWARQKFAHELLMETGHVS